MNHLETDVLVLGAGLAGLVTALAMPSRRVCVLAPNAPGQADTASELAQGGIAAAMAAGDSVVRHVRDTLQAGAYLGSVAAARHVCREAPATIEFLHALGVPFARDAGGWSVHREAAHSRARVLHVGGDGSGAAIMAVMRRRVADAPNVEVLSGARAVSLRSEGGVHGAIAIDRDGRPLAIRARAVVMATGGIGALYGHSTNPTGSCGDGLAMAHAAGARLAMLEFVQFHPTALDVAARPLPLLTEALRGAGARLVDDHGGDIMRGVHPLGALAPRDVVARAICALERSGGRARLDATERLAADVRSDFPAAYHSCLVHGFDLSRAPVPVTAAAHYHMGGIAVDLDGRTSIPHLWAVGEVACTGLHGANRLASNSLLEAVVCARRLGAVLDREASRPGANRVAPDFAPDECIDEPGERALCELMRRSMGVLRTASDLQAGQAGLLSGRERLPPSALVTRSRWALAGQMVRAALARTASIGAHHRCDSTSETPEPQRRRAAAVRTRAMIRSHLDRRSSTPW